MNITFDFSRDEMLFDIYPPYNLPDRLFESQSLKGLKIVYKLRDDKGFSLKAQGKSKRGNPIDFGVELLVATSSDATILTVTAEPDGTVKVEPVGPLGTAQVQVTVPDIHSDVPGQSLSGTFDVEVVSGVAATINFVPSATYDVVIPDPTIPPVTVDPNAPPAPVAGP